MTKITQKNVGTSHPYQERIYIPYLAFTDDLTILAYDQETARKQIETLKECEENVGLQISFVKTKY